MNLSSMHPKTFSPQNQKYASIATTGAQPTTVKKQHPLTTPYTHSPQRMNYSIISQEEELYRHNLERELQQARQDQDLQKVVSLRASELEGKVAEVIENNLSLQSQLDRSQKTAQQRQSEAVMWKQKYEAQQGQLMQIKSNYEQEIKSLSQEIQKVNARINSTEIDKNRTISDQKLVSESQNHQVQEHFRKSNSLQADMYESQINKLRDLLEDRTLQVAQLQTTLERQKIEASDAQMRLMNEVEQGKNRLSSIQIDHQTELQTLKSKLELYKDTHLRNAQFAHDNQQDILVNEINKLKNLLEIKNEEIDTLINQNQKQKIQADNEVATLREDIDQLKRQLLNNEQVHQQENHNIQSNLDTIHNNELTNAKLSHENQIQALNREILKLKEIIDIKNQEFQKQILEKQQQKDYYDGEVHRLINTIEDHKRKLALLEAEKNREINDLLNRIDRINIQNEAIQIDLQKTINLLSAELNNLKSLIDHKNQDNNSNLNQFSQIRADLEERIRQLNNELELQKLKAYETEKTRLQEIQELRQIIKELEVNHREKVRALESIIEHQKYEISKTMELFQNKSRECDNLVTQRNNAEQISKRLQDENDRLIDKVSHFEQEKNLEIDELRQKMDSGAAYQFENLKSAYNTQVGILSDQVADLTSQLNIKQRELTELIEKYSILDKTVLPESLIQRNNYNARTGVPAEFVANKSIHEAALRSQLRNSSIQRY